ncbi:lingual antimicrobial peptide-like [Pelodiscus sinensis]|uniref:lingual antimicrobial peptide-like n=1 Tax=Pelodiscus sinensis TaxID=13735 RepID=UPI0003C47C78|nr:lingual antimicrobial peptide-like [Pelodiscus sinensis]XP_006137074.1 lingual antimicrobial peptide-like [Pelodiscus sinensis]|eukprot:XP_006137073.1 lingual antimicrobial peptide-like [Pelodiscus sinensis]
MKILYLLVAVVFLVLMDAPGFSQGVVTRRQCRRQQGSCHFWRCPTQSIYIDRCIIGHCCRRSEIIPDGNKKIGWSSEVIF